MFAAQLEPTAVAKFPEAAVAKFTSEPEAAVAEFPEAAVAKSAAVEPEDTGSGSEANAVTAKVSSAEATSAKVRPAKAAPAEAASAVTEATSAKGRRTQRRAGCGDRRGDQSNDYLAHHGAYSIC